MRDGPRLYRHDLQAVRAVGALLVATFHIFELGVSGGVDVFFVVAGFFLWTTFSDRAWQRHAALHHYGRFITRNVPHALLVLAAAALLGYFFVSPVEWPAQLKNLASSALYLQNFWLIVEGKDYLARSEGLSIVQNFWALSVIAQVYLVWPLVFGAGRLLARLSGAPWPKATAATVIALSAASFLWSLHHVAVDPEAAYFDTAARFWQFGLGAIAAIYGPKALMTGRISAALSWLGLALVLSCGLVLGHQNFPGLASLWPSLGAVLILVFGNAAQSGNASAVLTVRPLVWLGALSYGIYLWHWPLYSIYLPYTGRAGVGLGEGAAIMGMAIVLAWGATAALARMTRAAAAHRRVAALVLCMAVMFAVMVQTTERLIALDHPLMADLHHPITGQSIADVIALREDLPVIFSNDCMQKEEGSELRSCSFGNPDAATSVYLVGGSHSAHWFPALMVAADELDLHITVVTKHTCRFLDPTSQSAGEVSETCAAWNAGVLALLQDKRPDYVLTLLTGPHDQTPTGFLQAFDILLAQGIGVIALRDVPAIGYDAAACVTHPFSAGFARCRVRRDAALNDALFARTVAALPEAIAVMDMTDQICDGAFCDAVRDGVFIWRDDDHLTASYAAHMGGVFTDRLAAILAR